MRVIARGTLNGFIRNRVERKSQKAVKAHVDAWYAEVTQHHVIDAPHPAAAIQFRMEQQNLSRKDLQPMIGSRARVSEVLTGKRGLTLAMIRRLKSGLGISADLLITPRQPELRGTLGKARMAIRRILIDYTVYTPSYLPGLGKCWDLRTLARAKAKARGLGPGARVHRNFNQVNRVGEPLEDWWQKDFYWLWDGRKFWKCFDRSGSSSWQVVSSPEPYRRFGLLRKKP